MFMVFNANDVKPILPLILMQEMKQYTRLFVLKSNVKFKINKSIVKHELGSINFLCPVDTKVVIMHYKNTDEQP